MIKVANDMRDAMMESSIRQSTMIHTTIQPAQNVDEDVVAIEKGKKLL